MLYQNHQAVRMKGVPSTHTVQAYVNALLESYFFYDIKRFDIKGKEYLRTMGKYYIVDMGLRNYLLGFRNRDSGHAIENVVYFELQKPYELQPEFVHDDRRFRAVTYVADFFIRYADGREEVIDTKGCPDTSAILKRKLFWYKYPDTTYIWVGYSRIDGGWVPYETIKKGRSERRKLKKQKMLEELKEEPNGKED